MALDPQVFDNEGVRPSVIQFIERQIERYGVRMLPDLVSFLDLYLTGSLTTYGWRDTSDFDLTIVPNYRELASFLDANEIFVRNELLAFVINYLDGLVIPGTMHHVQTFVAKESPSSGYSLTEQSWLQDTISGIELPSFHREDRMVEKMLAAQELDPELARRMWRLVHKKRQHEQVHNEGELSEGHLAYRRLKREGLDNLRKASSEDMLVVYDFDGDKILLGNYAMAMARPSAKILGHYDGEDVILRKLADQWVNPSYFRRLWKASFPDRPLRNVRLYDAKS